MLTRLSNRIVESIAATGCYVGDSIIDAALVVDLRERLLNLHSRQVLQAARVGRAATLIPAPQLRGDSIAWLDQNALDPVELRAMERINSLREALNKALYIGAVDTECHYARYPPGAFYKAHRDRFGDHDLRVVSLVFYLNEDWRDDDGGELLIHHPLHKSAQRVLPRCGTMAAFQSAQLLHEVLPATRPRLSLSGWMRRRPLPGQ